MRLYLRLTGEMLVTLGVLVFGFMAYMYWGTSLREAAAQEALQHALSRQWSQAGNRLTVLSSPGQLTTGTPFALIRIPAFGPHWEFAVVQGTGLAQLALGPGHVAGTALPGQVGNFVVAGHRVTAGNPFWGLPGLRAGAAVYIETVAGTYVYRLTGKPEWVPPDDGAVLAPVPYWPGRAPSQPMITLITCDPAWTGTSRVIVTGVLAETLPRAQGIEG